MENQLIIGDKNKNEDKFPFSVDQNTRTKFNPTIASIAHYGFRHNMKTAEQFPYLLKISSNKIR